MDENNDDLRADNWRGRRGEVGEEAALWLIDGAA